MKRTFDERLLDMNLDVNRDMDSRVPVRTTLPNMNTFARASMVNRTHRVVRERAKILQAHRSRVRSLWIPLATSSAFLLMICYAVWTLLDGYEVTPIGVPDSSDQFLVLLLWFFPVSMALLATILFRRARRRSGREVMQ